MKNYLAKIVYHIYTHNQKRQLQFDEQLRLIKADDEREAFQKAIHKGKSEEEAFMNNKNQLVKWIFLGVSELGEIGELNDGMELCSIIKETDDNDNYEELIKQRCLQIESKFITLNA